jgi:hypothetical protein
LLPITAESNSSFYFKSDWQRHYKKGKPGVQRITSISSLDKFPLIPLSSAKQGIKLWEYSIRIWMISAFTELTV